MLVDVIYSPSSGPVTDEVIERGREREVRLDADARHGARRRHGDEAPLALDETHLDFAGSLDVARPLREQIDWDSVRERTNRVPVCERRSSRSSRSSGSSSEAAG